MQIAIIAIDERSDPNDLKRLALVFDKLVVTMPERTRLKVGSEKKIFVSQKGRKRAKLSPFSYFDDTERIFAMPVQALPSSLGEVIQAFVDAEVAIVKYPDAELGEITPELKDFRNVLMAVDIANPTLQRISGTQSSEFGQIMVGHNDSVKLHRSLDDDFMPNSNSLLVTQAGQTRSIMRDGEEFYEEYLIREPQVVLDSYSVVSSLLLSDSLDAQPVFLNPRLRKHLKYRYEALKEKTPEESQDTKQGVNWQKARAGETSFTIAGEVLSSASVSSASAESIIAYRKRMTNAREDFMSSKLAELQKLLGSVFKPT